MKKNSFLLTGNGPYKNHGCEALVRGTVEILKQNYNNPQIIVASYCDRKTYIEQKNQEFEENIEHARLFFPIKYSADWIKYKLAKIVNKNEISTLRSRVLNNYINESNAVLSIGGDNYSLDYGNLDWFTDMDDYVLKHNKPMIIWGASVGPFSKDKQCEKYMSEHLKKITAIFARESETIKYLDSIGVRNNVYRVCDPAFMLEAKKPTKYNMEIEQEAIGINISPLMIKYVSNGNINEFIKVTVKIIEKIIKSTGRKLYFIPHVVIEGNSDYKIMNIIYDNIDEILRERIIKVSDKLNAAEYKWIISKMEVFFGARTHATIAALSTLVPTLSFVYSVKSVGINKDIFGNDEFCIYPDQFNDDVLVGKIKYLLDNKEEVQEHLKIRVSESKKLALKAGEYLKNVIK